MHPLRTVLCATDLSEAATEAIDQAAALALRENAALVVLHVIGVPVVVPSTVGEVVPPMVDPEILYARAEEALGRQLAARPAAARASRQVIRASGPIADEILQRAASLRADLLVMASHQQSAAERVLLGSTAGDVVRRARCPVLVARRSGHRGKVVVATDLSLASLAAMRAAGEEARRRQARLIAIHALDLPPPSVGLGGAAVVPAPPEDPRSLPAQRRAAGERLAAFLAKAEVQAEAVVAEGAAAPSIAALAEQAGAELVVVGTTSKHRLERVLLGSVADAVVRKAPCSVLTVPGANVAGEREGDLLDE